jgi:hypothetical protein
VLAARTFLFEMVSLIQLEVLIAVVEAGGFSGAAKKL